MRISLDAPLVLARGLREDDHAQRSLRHKETGELRAELGGAAPAVPAAHFKNTFQQSARERRQRHENVLENLS